MGDIIEKSLMSYDPLEFYKAGGKSIWIDIKTHENALIGLTSVPESQMCRWIEVCNPGIIRLNIGGETGVLNVLPFTLSNEYYTRIWLAWDSKCLWAGLGESLKVESSCELKIEINYFTISTRDRLHPCTFRFEVPPLCLTMPVAITPKITAGKLQWKSCDTQLPDDAVIGGYINGEVVYIIRAHHRGSLAPGVFIPSEGLAFIAWGGSDNPTPNFEALCGFNFEWKPACDAKIPAAALTAGYSENQHEPLFIGRAKHQGHVIPGKVQMSHKVCYIPYKGREVAVTQFDVLTVPGANPYSANKFVRLPSLPPLEDDGDFYYEDGGVEVHVYNHNQ